MALYYYQMIKSSVEDNDLKIFCIISPARSGSTFFMNVLAQSPSVHSFVNQPFHLTYSYPYRPPDNREEIAYQRIWEEYQQARKLYSTKTITLVIKCMARNLGVGQQALQLLQLVDKVILLIRNPFLSIDSLLKMQVSSIEDMPEATQHNLDKYAIQKLAIDQTGNGNYWQVLRNFILKTKKYRLITNLLVETLAFIELNRYEANMMHDYQYYFNCNLKHNFQDFFALSWTGWNNMAVLYKQHISKSVNYLVVDSTILRCIPRSICHEVSQILDIAYVPHMVNNWTTAQSNIIDDSVIKTSWMKCCYDEVTRSSAIRSPNESPISINLFPYIYQQHIIHEVCPTYLTLFKDKCTIRPRSYSAIHELLNISITDDGKTLKHVDPIFAEILASLC